METPSPYTEFGIKGMGEGGAIAPPAVIFNAVNDALRPLGAELHETPLTPRRLLAALERAKAAAGGEGARAMKAAALRLRPRRRHRRRRSRRSPERPARLRFSPAASRWGRC